MKYILSSILVAGTLIIGAESCKAKKGSAPTPGIAEIPAESASRCNDAITYTTHVKAIIDNSCALSCHSAKSHYAGIDLSNYEMVKAEAQKPRFMGALNHTGVYSPMPKKSPKLSDSTLLVLSCWIENGLK